MRQVNVTQCCATPTSDQAFQPLRTRRPDPPQPVLSRSATSDLPNWCTEPGASTATDRDFGGTRSVGAHELRTSGLTPPRCGLLHPNVIAVRRVGWRHRSCPHGVIMGEATKLSEEAEAIRERIRFYEMQAGYSADDVARENRAIADRLRALAEQLEAEAQQAAAQRR